jgi:branched-chain amino acid transport system substrate-binding protein
MIRSSLIAVFALAALTMSQAAPFAQISDDVVRIGTLGDMSGPNADQQGLGDVVADRMAVADFGVKLHGMPIEIIRGDLSGKTGVGIARRSFDQAWLWESECPLVHH